MTLCFVFVFVVVTILSLTTLNQFQVVKKQLLVNPTFLNQGQDWEQRGEGQVDFKNEALIIRTESGGRQIVSQRVPVVTPGYYRLSFDAGSIGVEAGKSRSHRATITLVHLDADFKKNGISSAAFLEGTTTKANFSKVVLLEGKVKNVEVMVRLFRAGGELEVSDLVLSVLKQSPGYITWQRVLSATWAAVLLILTWYVAIEVGSKQIVGPLLIGIIAIGGALMPARMAKLVYQHVADLLPESLLVQSQSWLENYLVTDFMVDTGGVISSLGHFSVFFCVGLVAGVYCRYLGTAYSVALVCVFALVTEALQMLVGGRTASVDDFVIDCGGGMVGMVAIVMIVGFGRNVMRWVGR